MRSKHTLSMSLVGKMRWETTTESGGEILFVGVKLEKKNTELG